MRQSYYGARSMPKPRRHRNRYHTVEENTFANIRYELDAYLRHIIRQELKTVLGSLGDHSFFGEVIYTVSQEALLGLTHAQKKPKMQQIARRAMATIKHFV